MSHDNPNFQALDWLAGEINESLTQARQHLEHFAAEADGDASLLQSCLALIHQVHGSLHMAELTGAAMLAEEMEQLVQALASGVVENSEETREFLMRALLELPLYLEKVAFQRRDNPVLLLPLLNDLRAVRRERLITEGAIFAPDLSPLDRATGKRQPITTDNARLQELVSKLRKMYHVAAAGLIRDVNSGENIAYLKKVCEKMSLLYSGSVRQPLWQILQGIFAAVDAHQLSVMPALRQLLRRIDVEFRLLQGRGAAVLDAQLDRDLVRNLLFYVYLSGPNGTQRESLYRTFALDRAVPGTPRPDTGDALAMGPEALGTAVAALREELRTLREALEPELAGGERAPLSETAAVAKRIADTLGVLGLEDHRTRARSVYEALRDASRSEAPDDLLMLAAGELVQLDSALQSAMSRNNRTDNSQPLMGDATESVLREARAGLEHVKESVVEYIASHWDSGYLSQVPERLQEVCGGLEMVGYRRAAEIVNACRRYISEQLISASAQPDWKLLDTLADAITSVEYYLERRAEGVEDADMLLALAEDSVAALGFAVSGVEDPVLTSTEGAFESSPEQSEEDDALAGFDMELESADTEGANTGEESSWFAASDESGSSDIAQSAAAATDSSADGEPASPEAPAEAQSSGAEEDDDESLIDDEIIEIFLEEAGEVLDTIAEYFPRWAANFGDEEALVEFRRGFHTLKGSGRMVEAADIGELAWAVENMLNRVIDESVKPQRAHAELVEQVRQKLPSMVDAFRQRQADPDPARTAQLESWAQQLSRGEIPSELEASSADVPEPQAADQDAAEEIDQLWEIFAQEAETHLAVVAEFLDEMRECAPVYGVPSDPLHRALHTLKGSAHMAEVTPVAQLIAPLERFAKELRTYQVPIDEDIFELISDGAEYVRTALGQIRAGEALEIEKCEQFLARVAELQERAVGHLIREREANEPRAVDPQLLAVIMADGMKVLLDADQMLNQWRSNPDDTALLEPMAEELQVLQEAASRAQLPTLADLSQLLLAVYRKVIEGRLEAEPALWASLEQGHNELLDLVDAVAAAQDLPEVSEAVEEALRYLVQDESTAVSDDDYDWAELGIDSADLPTTDDAGRWAVEAETTTPVSDTRDRELLEGLTLDGEAGTDSADHQRADAVLLDADGESLTAEPEAGDRDSQFDDLNFDDLLLAEEVVEQTDNGSPLTPDAESIAADGDENQFGEPVRAPQPTAASAGDSAAAETSEGSGEDPVMVGPDIEALLSDIDPDVVEVFMEEAGDLIDELEELIQAWEQDPSDTSQAEALKRVLHTFKGGARMAGLMGLGEVAHRFETVIEGMQGTAEPSAEFFADAHAIYDRLAGGVETVRAWMAGNEQEAFGLLLSTHWADDKLAEDANPVDYGIEARDPEPELPEADSQKPVRETAEPPRGSDDTAAPETPVDRADDGAIQELILAKRSGNVLPFVRKDGGIKPQESSSPSRGQPQEMVRVAAELLEELVNLAGETSISRGRLEEQVSDFGLALDEMDMTLQRLNEQLRRLDLETEAQILFRQEQLAEKDDDFDPLEMDRYSSIQQLSRSLMESTSDLLELRSTLGNKTRDTETLLLQQSRVNTELQEGLMRSRMVPFSRLVPRLRRIVRQVSAEVGKQVELVFSNVEGELDRSMLERMVAPLEHMLRNAVDHGIETPAERVAAGKPEKGRITVALEREGSEVVLTISDDGAGINLMKVRQRAVESGLMRPDAELSNNEILQFILQAGFSTAEKVTQISGRGVGLDVVSAEIKQIGGAVHINSQSGTGTEFVVRLPFTVSVNRALMVRIGEDLFALPLNTIEGIVRLSPFELEHYYRSAEARFEYAGEPYQVNYFGTLLQSEAQPKLSVEDMQLPVLLVRSEGHAMALQVDAIMGSREIVVKSLGPQFAAVQGVSGATVTGDGTVVVILDAHALLRRQAAQLARPETAALTLEPQQPAPQAQPAEERQQTVMVVDDSVTVRKVTTRFLEREGYIAVTAKDGQDAVIQLQDMKPDLILLDIEMPRMDGFEVARHIRSSSTLRDIPIVMITSRTGKKHRDHALSLGVNQYLGKPYQEEVLLAAIREHLPELAEH
ncbi:hybrid sensor histidine kinase/response regulator [Microbulbifer flavimaris]|uniref:histidine kinase n=1 Tax=Microbulbifer flavimaris TaxID=1781068 RepID=A0ABX4HYC8_9GAMM|nr:MULTISPECIES: Hpt domain-containing protein [Microbulbifer]KUJ82891.1 histidine kinase [Microbulbifer sp. ZGT114]PCO05071.1 hybrid sensor histidine kinase/response regulator [Microbulbifer flavimaris]